MRNWKKESVEGGLLQGYGDRMPGFANLRNKERFFWYEIGGWMDDAFDNSSIPTEQSGDQSLESRKSNACAYAINGILYTRCRRERFVTTDIDPRR